MRRLHRWLSYLLFAQISLWIIGGVAFAIIPFDSVIKGGAVLAPPAAPPLPGDWSARLAPHLATVPEVQGVLSHASAQGLLYEVRAPDGSRWVRHDDGTPARAPEPQAVRQFAESLHRGDAESTTVRRLEAGERRVLGLVDELYGRGDVWQVSFDDAYGTRIYLDGTTGRYLTVRNDYWVLYDALWRLHIMDYSGGEDFNNGWLRLFAPLSLLFVVTGLVLTWLAGQSALRRRA
jgi:hypothetical protein